MIKVFFKIFIMFNNLLYLKFFNLTGITNYQICYKNHQYFFFNCIFNSFKKDIKIFDDLFKKYY